MLLVFPGCVCFAKPVSGIEMPLVVVLTGMDSLTRSEDLCAETKASNMASFSVSSGMGRGPSPREVR